jgi:hypothetical protein
MARKCRLDTPSDRVVGNCFLYTLLSQLIWLEGFVDPDGRILELLNQFSTRRSEYFSPAQSMSEESWLVCSPEFL